MQVVARGDEFHVIDPNGRLMAAWPTEVEAQAWLAGIGFGIDTALSAIRLADEDTKNRMQGLLRIVQNYGTDAKSARVERRAAS